MLLTKAAQSKNFREIFHVDRSLINFSAGLREAIFVFVPFILALATGQLVLAYATLGALFLTNTLGSRTSSTSLKILLAACFIEATAFAVGRLVNTTGNLAISLVGVGVFTALM